MGYLGEVIGRVASCVCNCRTIPVEEQQKYLNSPTKQIETLRNKRAGLVTRMEDVKIRLQIAEEQGKTRTSEVQSWLNRANGLIVEVDGLEEKAKEARRFLHGVMPNCTSRLKLGQHISRLIVEVNDLLEKGGEFSDESLVFLAPKNESELHTTIVVGKTKNMEMLAPEESELPTTTLVGKTTTQKNMEIVWECLMDDETRTIGVYGMGGVGKTTIMKEINRRLLEQQHHFDKVILVTVSKGASNRKLQDEIAKALDLTLSNEGDERERSGLLLKALKQRKRLTLILDEVWQVFSLGEIGIPDFTNDSGCKLVLTSRSKDVCQMMGCRKCIPIELLSEDEAWELFLRFVDVKLAAEVEKIAKTVLEVCSRLPLAIITVGGAMRGTDNIQKWRDALTELQEFSNSILNMEEQVIECLKFGYNHLRDDIVKKRFLDCALFLEASGIDPEGLIEPWVMEGLINGKGIEYEVNQGHLILDTLKNSCMLECGSILGWEYVKMHDLVRDMALRITKEMNPRIIVEPGIPLEDFPNKAAWGEDLERVSFIGSAIEEIMISPNCPKLTTLLLNSIPSLKHIAHGFFVQLPGLEVLNLSFSGIELLPNSISDLLNLLVLDVSWCGGLKEVPSLEKLRSLKVLKLGYTMIEKLPHGVEELVDLKCLHLEGTRIRELPALLISKFSLLQELCMDHIPYCTSVVLMDEILSLIHLESLSIGFKTLPDFCYYQLESQHFKHLDYFSFFVGHGSDQTWKNFWKRGRSVLIHDDYSNHLLENALLLPQNTENLEIIEFDGLKSFPELVHFNKGVPTRDTLHCLKKLRIWYCETLEYLLKFQWLGQLQNLVEIDISDCSELEELIVASEEETGEGTTGACTSLKKIRLSGLPKLKAMFSKTMLQYFQNLEVVRIERCRGMEELIAEKEQVGSEGSSYNNTTILLPRLKMLDLEALPKLTSIWRGEMVSESLQTVKVKQCVQLKRLPQFCREDHFPPASLEDIRGSRKWWDTLEWDDTFVKNLLQPLFHEQDEDELTG